VVRLHRLRRSCRIARYVGRVLDEFYDLEQEGFVYQPWVQFSEPPFAGRFVNVDVDERGFPFVGPRTRPTGVTADR
jgi:hypothetical protein